jgi:hypothetical protein
MCARDARLPLRTSAVLLGILALLAQGTQLGHMLLVEHAICAEHGELVHGEAHQAVEPWALDAAAGQSMALRPGFAAEQAHAHEHCGTASERRDAVASAALTPLGLVRLDLIVAPPAELSPHPRPRAQLSLAPKTSPPAS